MSKVNVLYHIVFCTKNRDMTLDRQPREQLYRYIWKMIQERKCHLYRIGGIENHVHILLNLNPTVALADLMRELKANSSGWLKWNPLFPNFKGWGKEYYAATLAYADRNRVIDYIRDQEIHHNGENFDKEIKGLCNTEGMTLYEEDFM